MTEKPILFSGPMVKAILEGRKTMTRRVIKFNASGRVQAHGKQWHIDDSNVVLGAPYQPGDHLWVRETWVHIEPDIHPMYRADYKSTTQLAQLALGFKWRPSIFMPRWASRITLEVTGVRAERLQEITETDAISEGVKGGSCHPDFWVGAFRDLWDSINGKKHPWESNPYVWVYEFRRIA